MYILLVVLRRVEKPIGCGGTVFVVRRTVMLQKRVRVLSRAYFFRELPEHTAAGVFSSVFGAGVAIGEPRVHGKHLRETTIHAFTHQIHEIFKDESIGIF